MNERQPKFTPGPWSIFGSDGTCSRGEEYHRPVDQYGDHQLFRTMGAPIIAMGSTKDEIKANFRVINAAPDMYELLAEVEPHIDEWNFPITLKDRIEALLNKIDGGTPTPAEITLECKVERMKAEVMDALRDDLNRLDTCHEGHPDFNHIYGMTVAMKCAIAIINKHLGVAE